MQILKVYIIIEIGMFYVWQQRDWILTENEAREFVLFWELSSHIYNAKTALNVTKNAKRGP